MTTFREPKDIDFFLAEFEDPVLDLDRVMEALDSLFIESSLHQYTDVTKEIQRCFIHKLLIKAYRLGKDHGYARAAEVVKNRTLT